MNRKQNITDHNTRQIINDRRKGLNPGQHVLNSAGILNRRTCTGTETRGGSSATTSYPVSDVNSKLLNDESRSGIRRIQ
jgi:hypothetical protein